MGQLPKPCLPSIPSRASLGYWWCEAGRVAWLRRPGRFSAWTVGAPGSWPRAHRADPWTPQPLAPTFPSQGRERLRGGWWRRLLVSVLSAACHRNGSTWQRLVEGNGPSWALPATMP